MDSSNSGSFLKITHYIVTLSKVGRVNYNFILAYSVKLFAMSTCQSIQLLYIISIHEIFLNVRSEFLKLRNDYERCSNNIPFVVNKAYLFNQPFIKRLSKTKLKLTS